MLSHSVVSYSCDPIDYSLPGSMGFSRQEYQSGLPFPSPGDLPHPGIEPRSPDHTQDIKLLWLCWILHPYCFIQNSRHKKSALCGDLLSCPLRVLGSQDLSIIILSSTLSKIYTETSYLEVISKVKISRPPQIANTKIGWTFGCFWPTSLFLFKWSTFLGVFVSAWVCFCLFVCLFCFPFQRISFLSPKYRHHSNLWSQDNCCLFASFSQRIANTTTFSIFSVHMSVSNLRL